MMMFTDKSGLKRDLLKPSCIGQCGIKQIRMIIAVLLWSQSNVLCVFRVSLSLPPHPAPARSFLFFFFYPAKIYLYIF